jgi:hypothetical protein
LDKRCIRILYQRSSCRIHRDALDHLVQLSTTTKNQKKSRITSKSDVDECGGCFSRNVFVCDSEFTILAAKTLVKLMILESGSLVNPLIIQEQPKIKIHLL